MGHLWKIMLWYMKIFFLNIQMKDTWSFNKRYEDLIVLGEGSEERLENSKPNYERDVRAIHVTKALTLWRANQNWHHCVTSIRIQVNQVSTGKLWVVVVVVVFTQLQDLSSSNTLSFLPRRNFANLLDPSGYVKHI